MTSHPTRSYTRKTSNARLTPCAPSTAIVRMLCVATVISRPRALARLLVFLCRRRCGSALPRRLRLRAKNVLLFVTLSMFSLSLFPLLPAYVLVSRRGFSRPASRRPAHLPSPKRSWCLLTGSSPASRFLRRYASFDAMTVGTNGLTCGFQLAVHRRCHRLCRYDHSTPGLLTVSSLPRVRSTPAGRQPGRRRGEVPVWMQHLHDSAYWLPTRKKLLYTVANPARGLLNREKIK